MASAPGTPAPPPKPRPAATVVLLRDSDDGPEALLTKRQEGLRFMAGATVFPGGAVDAADLDPRWEQASTLSRVAAAKLLDDADPDRALGFFVCALREAFEEVGWIETSTVTGALRRTDADDAIRWLERCIEENVVLRTDELVPAGRWVTPQGSPIRFDTHFFVAPAHGDWSPEVDESEVAAEWWSTPARALDEQSVGELLMAPPTIEMLQRLAGHPDVAAILRSLRDQSKGAAGQATRLSPFVQVVVAPNSSVMTGPGTNTYIVGADPSFVIDPAVDDDGFLDAVVAAAGRVSEILITHRHSDHVGGAAALAERTGARVRAFGRAPAGEAPVEAVADEDALSAGSVELVALHTPGHASDHLSYLLAGAASLFAGDNILGEGTAVIAPPDGDMRAYLETLHRLRSLKLVRIYPGHWQPLDGGRAVVDRYLAHRMAREAAIREAVAAGATSVDEIVERVYVDTPAHLHPIAAYSVLAHLEMLEDAGRVKLVNEHWAPVDVD